MDIQANEYETDEIVYSRYLKSGDNEDLKALFIRYREELTFFIYGFIGNMEDAEDIMMDAFAVVTSGTAHFSGKSSFKTWLFAIGRNIAHKTLRKLSRMNIGINNQMVDDTEIPDEQFFKSERSRVLYKALSGINPDYRQVLHLTYFEDMKNDEVALVMNKSKKQVYNLIARGKIALKETLVNMGYDSMI